MQFFSPAQIVFVLWLLTAAAPAATVLLNGAMLPVSGVIPGVESTIATVTRCEENGGEATVEKDALATQGLAVAERLESRCVLGFSSSTAELPLTSSVLHTAVQRHRPRSA